MQSILKILMCLLLLYVVGVSCSDESKQNSNSKQAIQQPLNPNGDSELALLMRAMFDEAQQIKTQITNGDAISLSLDHEKILTAHATQPKKAASAKYKAFAKTYLQAIENLKTANVSQRADLYDNLVNNCMTCHQALCPGPIAKIKKLQ